MIMIMAIVLLLFHFIFIFIISFLSLIEVLLGFLGCCLEKGQLASKLGLAVSIMGELGNLCY